MKIHLLILISLVSLTSACVHTPPTYNTYKGLLYSSSPEDLKGDLYIPIDRANAPIVIAIHGGGWTRRSREDMNEVALELARKGFAVFNISYRLAPKYRFPEQVKDIRAAIRFLSDNAKEYGYDINRLALYGYSAGGHLAALVGMANDLERGPKDTVKIKAVVAGGTPADLTKYEDSELVVKLMGGKYSEMRDAYKKASPMFHVNRGDPPIFLFHGKNDWIVEYQQMVDFERKLDEEGVGVETLTIPLIGHVAVFLYSGTAVQKSIQFLQDNLK
jgi:acetyl esterase/lipase